MRSPQFRRTGNLLWQASFWLCTAFAAVMALLPKPPHVPLDRFGDKLEHMAAFAVLSALALLAFPAASRLRLGLWLAALGAGLEVAQGTPVFQRDCDLRDWLVEAAVIALVLGLAALLQRRRVIPR
jgi:hypothetical protein